MNKSILVFLLLLNTTVLAQEYTTKNKKAIQFYEPVEFLMIRRQFPEAIQQLQLALEKDDKFAEAHQAIARCYQALNDYDKALYHFSEVTRLQPDNRRFMVSYYGKAGLKFRKGEYEEAIPLIEKFLGFNPGKNKLVDDANKLLRDARFSMEAIKDSIPFNPRPIPNPINQLPMQYFPILSADGKQLIFTGRKGFGSLDDEDIYFSQKVNGQWGVPGSISSAINTLNNEGTCTISADGRILIFTSCAGRKGFGSCDLYITRKEGDTWAKPVNLGSTVNSEAWDSQPSLSQDGRTLYFVSNRRGGKGLRDIWVTTLDENDQWREPVNLSAVNTQEDEVSPFIHPDNQTLYFASKGYAGFGGFDLYRTERTESGWSGPENLGYPLNSADDQVSLFVSRDGKVGMYSFEKRFNTLAYSYLYEFDVPDQISVRKKSNYVSGRVFDSKTKTPIKAVIELKKLGADERVALVTSDSVSGDYLIVLTEGSEYSLFTEKSGYLFSSLSFNYLDSISDPVTVDIYLDPIEKNKSVVLNNIFFDFDKADLKEKSVTELKQILHFMMNNPDLKIEISGHTDNSGQAQYNLDLSLRRAKTVHQYLIDQGIDSSRISYKGYGQDQPIESNDTEEGRMMNRRIEFRIL